jgi:hypothetical protein
MDAFDFLDLVIGLIFIYLIYSIAASALWEIFVNASHLKGNMLCKWIMSNFKELNYSDNQRNKILDHPLISLFDYPIIDWNSKNYGVVESTDSKKTKTPAFAKRKPIYISSKVFTDVLVDLVIHESDNPVIPLKIDLDQFKASLVKTKCLPDGLKRVFLQYADEASDSLQKVKEKISAWYDEAQSRLIGSYKKNLQMWIFLISAILVGSTNADTFNLVSYLYNNNAAREAIATKASLFVQDSSIVNLIHRIDTTSVDIAAKRDQEEIVKHLKSQVTILNSLNSELKQNNIPIGWNQPGLDGKKQSKGQDINWLKKIIGLLITTLAVGLGSPFWFDVLSKLSNLRSSGKKPDTLNEELEKLEKNKIK